MPTPWRVHSAVAASCGAALLRCGHDQTLADQVRCGRDAYRSRVAAAARGRKPAASEAPWSSCSPPPYRAAPRGPARPPTGRRWRWHASAHAAAGPGPGAPGARASAASSAPQQCGRRVASAGARQHAWRWRRPCWDAWRTRVHGALQSSSPQPAQGSRAVARVRGCMARLVSERAASCTQGSQSSHRRGDLCLPCIIASVISPVAEVAVTNGLCLSINVS